MYSKYTGNSFGPFSENNQGLGPARRYVSLPQKNNVASLTIDPRSVPQPSEARKLAQTRMQALRTQREAILQGFSLGGRRRELRDLSERNRGRCMSFKITTGSFSSSGSRNLNHRQTKGFFLWLDDFGRFFQNESYEVAPYLTSYTWRHNPYKWPYKWDNWGYFTLKMEL